MIIILGKSASGKSTLQDNLIKEHPEYHKVVTYTTRPMREGEVDGVNYHFISQKMFDSFIEQGFFVEYAQYRDWSYGTAKTDCEDDNAVAVLTPAGLRALKRLGYDVTSIYIHIDRRTQLISILNRGDDIDEAYRRCLSDVGQFDAVDKEVDYVIDNTKFKLSKQEVLNLLEEYLNIKSSPEWEQLTLFNKEQK